MADILDAAQPVTTPPAADPSATPPPPPEPAPEPPVATPTPPVTDVSQMTTPPSTQGDDSLIVPPPAAPPPEPPVQEEAKPEETPPTPEPPKEEPKTEELPPVDMTPKKKRISPAVIITGFLLLFITLPLVGLVIKNSTEIRSQAAKKQQVIKLNSQKAQKAAQKAGGDTGTLTVNLNCSVLTGNAKALCLENNEVAKTQTNTTGKAATAQNTTDPKVIASLIANSTCGSGDTKCRDDVTNIVETNYTQNSGTAGPPGDTTCRTIGCPSGQICQGGGNPGSLTYSCVASTASSCVAQNISKPTCDNGCSPLCVPGGPGGRTGASPPSWSCPTTCPGALKSCDPPFKGNAKTPSLPGNCDSICGAGNWTVTLAGQGICNPTPTGAAGTCSIENEPYCNSGCERFCDNGTWKCRQMSGANQLTCASTTPTPLVKQTPSSKCPGGDSATACTQPCFVRMCLDSGIFDCVPDPNCGGGGGGGGNGGGGGGGGGGNNPTNPPAQCDSIRVYNSSGTALTSSDLSGLAPGTTITLGYTPPSASTKVRFQVNSNGWNETTTKNGSEFRWDYKLDNVANFSIQTQWWDGSNWN